MIDEIRSLTLVRDEHQDFATLFQTDNLAMIINVIS